MKRIVSVLILAVLVLSLFAVVGCSSTGDNGDDTGYTGNTIPGGMADVSEEVLEALQNSGEVKVYTFGDDMETTKPIYNGWFNQAEFQEYFEAVYGGKITIQNGVWSGWEQRFVIEFASGDAPDLIYTPARLWPKAANREMVFSLSDLEELGVVGLDHPVLQEGLDTVKNNFTYKNEVYGFALQDSMCFWAVVNTDLFARYSVKSPVEYFNEGLWNLDTFVECAQALTNAAGVDANGLKNASGYYCWTNTALTRANGQHIISVDPATGDLTLNTDKPEVKEILELYRNGTDTTGFIAGTDTFANGNIGISSWMDENFVGNYSNLTFNWEVVPFPLGDANTTGMIPGAVRAWGVVSSSENAQGAVNLVIALKTAIEQNMFEVDKSHYSTILTDKPETVQMMQDYIYNGVNDTLQGIAQANSIGGGLWNRLGKNRETVNEALEAINPKFQAEIQAELAGAT